MYSIGRKRIKRGFRNPNKRKRERNLMYNPQPKEIPDEEIIWRELRRIGEPIIQITHMEEVHEEKERQE